MLLSTVWCLEKIFLKQHLSLQRRCRVCQMCGWWCVLLLCGCVSQDYRRWLCVQSSASASSNFLPQPTLMLPRDFVNLVEETPPFSLHANQIAPSGCLSSSCSHSQFTHSDESNLHRYLSKAEVAQASLSKAQQGGGSVRLVTKEQFFSKRRPSAASPPASHRWVQSCDTFGLSYLKFSRIQSRSFLVKVRFLDLDITMACVITWISAFGFGVFSFFFLQLFPWRCIFALRASHRGPQSVLVQ